jgi:hypothetical protein
MATSVYTNQAECDLVGLDLKKVNSLSRRLRALGKEASNLDITIFGGSGYCTLRYADTSGKPSLIVAEIGGNNFDGGDGGIVMDSDGFLRGE